MVRSGKTSNGDKVAYGEATMRGSGRRYFKIPPMIDHQAGSFLVDRLRLLRAAARPHSIAAAHLGRVLQHRVGELGGPRPGEADLDAARP